MVTQRFGLLLLTGTLFSMAPCSCERHPDSASSDAESGSPAGSPASGDIVFAEDIKPILEARCLICHNTGTLLGYLNLENRELAFAPGPEGPFILPGDPESSKLYYVTLKPKDDPAAMPPDKHQLTDQEQELIRLWIEQGAEWPGGPEGQLHTIPEPKQS